MFLETAIKLPTSGFRLPASAALGALMTLAQPPVGAFFALLLCVPGFIRLAKSCPTKKDAFLTGWAFGAGYFILGLYWISFALFVDIGAWWWVLPLSVVAGPAALGLYYGLIPLLAWRYRAHDVSYALMFVAAWSLVEWVRGHALTGFPWNLPGYAWHRVLPVMQANAAVGIYGVTLLTLLWAALPALRKKFAAAAIVSLTLVAAAGLARLSLHPGAPDARVIRVVQPNIPQSVKWNAEDMTRNFRRLLDLTSSPAARPVAFVVWPETAVVADGESLPGISRAVSRALPEGSVALLGSLRIAEEKFYNSVLAIDRRGRVLAAYDKHHLVPFGEYIPFRRYLNLTPLAAGIAGIGDFTRGEGVSTLRIDGLPKPSPLVCYEAIFPGAVARRDDRPDWLLNVTNDAWYGETAGPHQHFEIARVRAVEEGLPLARAANTGISAVVDPFGRVIGMKPLGDAGVIDAALPRPLPPTLYARFGDALFFLMLALAAIGGETLRMKKGTVS